jgi:hypothetical protein
VTDASGPAPADTPLPAGSYNLLVFLAGAVYGLAMRLAFGMVPFGRFGGSEAAGATGVMLSSFVMLVPFLLGAFAVYADRGRAGIWRAVFIPWIPIGLFVGGTAILLIEGSICIAMATPIFLCMGSIGGLIMWTVLRAYRPSRGTMGSLLLLPLLAGAWEQGQPLPPRVQVSTASVVIAAPPERIWHLINDAAGIRPDEMAQGLAYRIGVPYPQSALTVVENGQRVRKLRWDHGVHFDEPITAWEEDRYIAWRYSFLPGSIPADALDEHVQIGGRHFDLLDTSYRLTPQAGGTRLDIRVTYRISTRFNWYATTLGRVLVDDAARTILSFYQRRAEAAPTAAGER